MLALAGALPAVIVLSGASRLPPPVALRAASPQLCAANAAQPPSEPMLAVTERVEQMARAGQLAEAIAMLRASVADGAPPRSSAWGALVAACRRASDLNTATDLLGEMRAVGLRANPNQYSSLIDALVTAGQPARAAALLQHMEAACGRCDSRSHTVTIGALLRAGADDDALRVTHSVLASLDAPPPEGTSAPDVPLFNVMLQAALRNGAEDDSRRVLAHMRAAGLQPSPRTLNIMLSSLARRDQLPAALEVFNSFCDAGGVPSAISFNILMAAFAARGELGNAEGLLLQMRSQGVRPDSYTLNALLRAAAGCTPTRPYRALAHWRLLTRGGARRAARRACRADAESVAHLARSLDPAGLGLRAVREARRAVAAGARLDAPCRATLLRACSHVPEEQAAAACEAARWVWDAGDTERGAGADGKSVLYMVRILGRVGDVAGARAVFDAQPPPRSPSAWSELLRLECKYEQPGLALDVLKRTLSSPNGQS